MKYLIFRIKEELFGIDIMRIVEILNPLDVHKVPELPDFIVGVISLRGDVIPLINLRKRFGIEDRAEKERVVIIRLNGEKVGIIVDSVTEIRDIPDDRIQRPSKLFKGFKAEFLTGIVEIESGEVVIIMDIDKVLTSEERVKLEKSRKKFSDKIINNKKGKGD